jgi:hypothetical protein
MASNEKSNYMQKSYRPSKVLIPAYISNKVDLVRFSFRKRLNRKQFLWIIHAPMCMIGGYLYRQTAAD